MKKDRNGVLVLIVLIVLTIAGHYVVDQIDIKSHADITGMVKVFEAWEKEKKDRTNSLNFFYFNPNTISKEQLDSLNLPQFVKGNIIRYREAGGKFSHTSDLQKIYGMNDSLFKEVEPWLVLPDKISDNVNTRSMTPDNPKKGTFDPNSASTEELSEFGFNKFQASNIEKYRAKGGHFDVPGDVMKIYGVDSDLFLSVEEHIKINQSPGNNSQSEIQVELNCADSLELVKLRGIGPVFAARIIKYRNLLGGFFSVEQLQEVYGFPEETYTQLKDNLVADTLHLRKIRVNFAGYTDLIRHPYIKQNHVEAILTYRDKHGPFASEEQLLRNSLIDSVTFLRIKPYLTCR